MKMKKSIYIIGGVVVVLAVCAYVLFAKRDSRKYDFRFDKVSKGDLMVYVTATGTINAVISVDVGTQVSGIVTKLFADFNSVVRAGEVIARIDTTFLYQSVKDAEASLDRARAQFADSKRNLDRVSELFKKGLESELNYSASLTTFESNQASLKQAQASVDRAKINLAYATIYAPINGVVTDRKVNVGQTVAASFSSPTLFTIANDLKRMQVQTTVDESDVGKISIGQEATFTVDAYPEEKFTGKVSQIRLAPQSIQNVVNYIVIIDVQNDQLKLMPGMTANVKVLVASATEVLRVPNMALRFQPPTDIIDTVAMNALRGGFGGRGDMGGDSTRMGRNLSGAADSAARGGVGQNRQGGFGENRQGGGQGAEGGGFRPQGDMMARFQTLRDSIQAAHKGKLSQEEMRAEMQKLFANRMSPRNQTMPQTASRQSASSDAAKFGIVSKFPEYQKSAYVPSHQSGRGKIWILKASGLLEPISVRTGLNDGRYTEVTTMRLNPGDQIVIGASSGDVAVGQTASPLTGQGQQRPMGGGGFGR
ncbi:MAG: efflux RND transporter periplasmic adaptor subunit [Ignavibacteriales bacterium]|nr:efflux RND transporter periplasmic adaptor subunit [Ignavibacteriales bacterium]